MNDVTKQAEIGIMLDLETLDLDPRAVVTQIAMVAFPLDDPSTILKEASEILPIQPQLTLNRTIGGDTLIWWLTSPDVDDKARARFRDSSGNDMDELLALVRSINRKFCQITAGKTYEIWARGPQFDVVKTETLFADCGQAIPWKYDTIRDLRTMMKLAGVESSDVSNEGLVMHRALDDCKFQIRCYESAITNLRR